MTQRPKIIDASYRMVRGPVPHWFGSWRGLFWFCVVFGAIYLSALHRGGG